MSTVTARLCGNAVEMSVDGKLPFPHELRQPVEEQLSFKHVQVLRGMQKYDQYRAGLRRPTRVETRRLFAYDKYDRLVFGAGLLSRVERCLRDLGWSVSFIDVTPPHPRQDRFYEDWDNVVRNFNFRARQDECLTKLASVDRGVIDAPTGFGKSFLYAAIGLLFPRAHIRIVTKRLDLVSGARRHMMNYLPNIGQVGGGQNEIGRITIVSADSLHKVDPDFCDILIGEEAHQLVAPAYAGRLAQFQRSRMYGFTATPTGRMDGTDKRLESLFGPVVFQMTYPEAVELGLVVPIRVRWIDTVEPGNPAEGMSDVPKLRHGIWRNEARNRRIADEAHLYGDDDQVLIMVTTLEHALYLRQYLPEFTICHAGGKEDRRTEGFIKRGLATEEDFRMSAARRRALREAFEKRELKKVIATDVWSTGVSFDSLSILIRADARGSTIMDTQIPGRVCRTDAATDKSEGLVIDMLDEFDRGFSAQARKRRRNYESKGWEQEFPLGYALRRRS